MSHSQFDVNDLWEEFCFRSTEQVGCFYSLEINFLSNKGNSTQRHKSKDSFTPRKHNLFVKFGYSPVIQLADCISRVIRDTINRLLSTAKTYENPECRLDQPILDMQQDLVKLHDAVARASATQKSIKQQYYQYRSIPGLQINLLRSRQDEQLTANNGQDFLATQNSIFAKISEYSPQETPIPQKIDAETGAGLKAQLDEQTALVDKLKRQLFALDSKIFEAKTKKELLNSSVAAEQANEQLEQLLNIIDCLEPSWEVAIDLCEKELTEQLTSQTIHIIEEKILQIDARFQDRLPTIAVLICWKEELTNWKSQLLYRLILEQQEDLEILAQLIRKLCKINDTRLVEQATGAIVAHKGNQLQYRQVKRLAIRCREGAKLALQKGDENRAREWIIRKNSVIKRASILNDKLGEQIPLVEELKQNLKELVNKCKDDEQTPIRDEIQRKLKELNPQIAEFKILYGRVIDSIKIVRASQNRFIKFWGRGNK